MPDKPFSFCRELPPHEAPKPPLLQSRRHGLSRTVRKRRVPRRPPPGKRRGTIRHGGFLSVRAIFSRKFLWLIHKNPRSKRKPKNHYNLGPHRTAQKLHEAFANTHAAKQNLKITTASVRGGQRNSDTRCGHWLLAKGAGGFSGAFRRRAAKLCL